MATRFTWESLTVPVTSYEPGEKITIAYVVPPAETDCPALMLTWDTMPGIGAVSVAPSTWCCSVSTLTWSIWICASSI